MKTGRPRRRLFSIQVLAIVLAMALICLPQPSHSQPELQVTVGTSNTLYSPGERVTIIGRVVDPSTQPVSEVEVSIQVSNPAGGIVRIGWALTNSTGYYTDQFSLERNAASGTYRINVIASKEGYTEGVAESTFEVKAESTDFEISLEPQSQSIIQGQTAQLTLTISSKYGFDQPVQLTYSTLPPMSTCTFSDSSVTPSSTSTATITTSLNSPPGFYTVTIVGSGGGKTHSASALITIQSAQSPSNPDFAISITPGSRSITAGETATFTVTLAPTGGFSSTVTLKISGLPEGSRADFNQNPISNLALGGAQTTLQIQTSNSTESSAYQLTVTAEGGGKTRRRTVTLIIGKVTDFTLTVDPSSQAVLQGQSAIYQVTVTSIGGFSSPVLLTLSTSAVCGTTFDSNPITPPQDGLSTSTLRITTSLNTSLTEHTLTIFGTAGTLVHSVTATLRVDARSNIAFSANPSDITITRGNQGNLTLTVSSVNGFNSNVSFTAKNLPEGLTARFTPQTIKVSSTSSSTLTITAGDDILPGVYHINVKAQSESLEREIEVIVNVEGAKSNCLIATATYGSELADEVQTLRSFRDNRIVASFAGRQFMLVFNSWYYSFSPAIAESIRKNGSSREVVKIVLYPLIEILRIAEITYEYLPLKSEITVVIAGFISSSLIGIIYAAPIRIAFKILLRVSRLKVKASFTKYQASALCLSTVLIAVAEVTSLEVLMRVATASFVIASIAASSSLTLNVAGYIRKRVLREIKPRIRLLRRVTTERWQF